MYISSAFSFCSNLYFHSFFPFWSHAPCIDWTGKITISQVSVFSSLNHLLTTIHMSSFNLVLIPNMVPELFPLIEKWQICDFYWGLCYSVFSFICIFCRSLFVLLYFFFWPSCCLFFDLRIPITSLVSSNPSWYFNTMDMKIKFIFGYIVLCLLQ